MRTLYDSTKADCTIERHPSHPNPQHPGICDRLGGIGGRHRRGRPAGPGGGGAARGLTFVPRLPVGLQPRGDFREPSPPGDGAVRPMNGPIPLAAAPAPALARGNRGTRLPGKRPTGSHRCPSHPPSAKECPDSALRAARLSAAEGLGPPKSPNPGQNRPVLDDPEQKTPENPAMEALQQPSPYLHPSEEAAPPVNGHRKVHSWHRSPQRERSDRSGDRCLDLVGPHDPSSLLEFSASTALEAVGWMDLESSM